MITGTLRLPRPVLIPIVPNRYDYSRRNQDLGLEERRDRLVVRRGTQGLWRAEPVERHATQGANCTSSLRRLRILTLIIAVYGCVAVHADSTIPPNRSLSYPRKILLLRHRPLADSSISAKSIRVINVFRTWSGDDVVRISSRDRTSQ
jgi:hypothetical protein